MPADVAATADWYRTFGTIDAPGSSQCYTDWALGVADDPELISRIDQWPHNKRQPLLLFAAARFLGAGIGPYPAFREFLDANWAAVTRTVLSRATQTNEAGRCATLLPSLARIASEERRPLALLEVGASAGLALFPDRYSYEFDDGKTVARLSPVTPADMGPVLHCDVTGPVPVPPRLPRVVWRAGIDLNPLDVRDPDDVAWLEALVWPEQDFRRERLHRAIAIAQLEPPFLVAGHLNDHLQGLADQAPADAALVVFHSAVMAYLSSRERAQFQAIMADLTARGSHWLSNEGNTVIEQEDGSSVVPNVGEARLQGRFLLSHNGEPVAITGPHGQSLEWL
jgi:hypothetical protein